jgi:succinate dehydrogenase / fumarate reductase membrane anchor subunit
MLARVRHLGSAKDGTAHWWAQRLTAIALVPLSIWCVASMVVLTGAPHMDVAAWLSRPLPVILMILLIVATFHHAQLGLQAVIDDYVHQPVLRVASLMIVKFAACGLGLAAVFAVLKIAFGG